MPFTYQWLLVALSVFIAVFGSYTTLSFASRLAWADKQSLPYWIVGGGCAMGIGIWGTHFVGMLALDLPTVIAFDPALTALSMVPAILAAVLALNIFGHNSVSPFANGLAAGLMGCGIAAMHYIGMAAMKMTPPIEYNSPLLVLSVVIAIMASRAALHIVSLERGNVPPTFLRRLAGSAVMGLAIAGMHYTGMAAAEFLPGAVCSVAESAWTGSTVASIVVVLVLLILTGSLAFAYYEELSGKNTFYKTLLAAQSDAGEGVAVIENERIIYANLAMEKITGYSHHALLTLPNWQQLLAAPELISVAAANPNRHKNAARRTEVEVTKLNGEKIPCDAVITPFRHAAKARNLLIFFDISGRKTAEQALVRREEEAQELALVASNTDNAVIITDAQGLITWVNKGFEKMTGYSLIEAKGQNPGKLLQGPDTDTLVRQRIHDQIARGEALEAEILNYDKSGRSYWVSIAVKPVRDANGVLFKFIALELDITQRKLDELALQNSEAEAKEMALVASRTDQAVIIMDAQRNITWVNEGFSRMTGYSLIEVRGKMPGDFLHGPLTDANTVQQLRKSFETGESFNLDIYHYHKNGRPFMAALDILPVRNDNGEIFKYISMERDITERMRTTESLRKSDSLLREAHAIAKIGYWEDDFLANETSLSLEAQAIYEIYPPNGRCQRTELAARTHPDDLDRLEQVRHKAVSNLSTYFVAIRLLLPDGRIKYVQLRGSVQADEHGKPARLLGTFQDVTEQMQSDQALRAKEEEAREMALIAAGTDNAVLFLTPNAKIVWVNDSFVKMSGYSAEEAIGKRPSELLNGQDTDPGTLALIQDKLARRERFEFEILHYRKGGQKYWAIIDVQAVIDSAGNVVKYISIERDITSRKLAEQELRLSEIRLKEAQQLAHIGSFEFDPSDNTCIVSDELLRIHEITAPGNRVPRSVLMSHIHPQDMQKFLDAQNEAIAANRGYSVQLRHLHPQGKVKHVQMRGDIRKKADGTLIAAVGTVQDINELKLAELALIDLNESLEGKVKERTLELETQRSFTETVLRTAENLIFVVDWRGRFVRFNGACERLTGYKFAELKDRPLWEFVITPERIGACRLKHENQRDPKKIAINLEVEWLTRKGSRRLIAWTNATLIDAEGRLEYMIGTGVDITERKANELALLQANQNLNLTISTLRDTQSQLVQSEKMASLGGLVAGISHEINTPIGVGLTAATALQEEFNTLRQDFENGTMKRSDLGRFITQGLAGYDILVNNLLRAADLIRSFKQVAVDQSSDAWRTVNLHDYINEVLLSLQPRLKGRKVSVLNAAPEELVIYTHPGAIYQIVTNLLINSLIHAFAPEEPGRIKIAATKIGGEIQLVFSDDGRGIPEEIRTQVFDPFFTTRRGMGGSGLGLHIVFNLVASTLNGRISLVDSGGQGAIFKIRFPLQKEAAK